MFFIGPSFMLVFYIVRDIFRGGSVGTFFGISAGVIALFALFSPVVALLVIIAVILLHIGGNHG